jgi:hypothetical protein
MLLNWLRRGPKPSRSVARCRRRIAFLPSLEPLETRLAPATWSGDIFDVSPGVPLLTNTSVQEFIGNVHVPVGKTLTVQAGTVVKFDAGTSLTVDGTLLAGGTVGQTIIFTSIRDNSPEGGSNDASRGDWGRILFTSTSTGDALDHAIVRYGGGGVDAEVEADNTSPSITNSEFSNAPGFGLRLTGSNAVVTGDSFHDNDIPENGSGVGGAIHMDVNSQPTFSGITFTNNWVNGVWIDPGTLPAGTSNWNNPSVVYFVPRTVTVPPTATLNIAAGQVVKLDRSVIVQGTLQATGTAANPVIFTSANDDSVGGSTTPFGTPGVPHRGDWNQIQFTSTSTGDVLDHVIVRYGGGGVDAEVEADNASPSITNSEFSNAPGFGLRLTGSNATVTGDTFHDNDIPENGSGVGGAIHMDVNSQPVISGITFSNNWVNAVWIDPGTLPAGTSNWNNPSVVYFVPRTVTVPAGAALDVAAGQVVKLARSLVVQGTLLAPGTTANPVIFTSANDDSVGGSTTPFGTPGVPHRGDWNQIQFTGTSTGDVLDHTIVRYGGGGVDAEVEADNASPSITNSEFSNAPGFGLRLTGSDAAVTGDSFHDNDIPENGSGVGGAIHMDVSSQPVISGITFTNNWVNAVWIDPGTLPAGTSNWNNPSVVYFVPRTVTVPVGATLDVAAGQIVKLARSLVVQGTLLAPGTTANPVIFTSFSDDSVGGPTTPFGTPGSPQPGDWNSIEFTSTSTGSVLNHIEALYGTDSGDGTPGTISVTGAGLTVSNSAIGNSGDVGVEADTGSTLNLISCVVENNTHGAGVRGDSGATLNVINCTIDGNSRGVLLKSPTATLTNDLVTNSLSDGFLQAGTTNPTISFSDVFNPGANNYTGLSDQTGTNGNLSVDPSYLDRAGGDFRVHPGSPVEDAGTSAGAPATDFLGNPRFKDPFLTGRGDGSGYDMGAFEVQYSVVSDLAFGAAAYSVVDTDGPATIVVTRGGNSTDSVTVHYATSDGSARADTDYVATSGDLTFSPGVTTQTFTVPIIDRGPLASPLSLNLTLSNPRGFGAVLGTPKAAVLTIGGTGVVRTITYDQITALTGSNTPNAGATILSAHGNRAVFAANSGAVYTVNSDGTGLTLVDPSGGADLDISADGSVVLERSNHGDSGDEFRVVNADGSNLHVAFDTGSYSASIAGRLSADDKTVFFEDSYPFTVGGVTDPPGVYAVDAAGGGTPQLIASQGQVAALLGTAPGNIDLFDGEPGGLFLGLGVSADASHLVFHASLNGVGDFLVGVNRDGSGLHTIGPVGVSGDNMAEDGISGDGSTVFRYDSVNEAPFQLTVYHFDGSGQLTLSVPGGLGAHTAGPEHVQLTQDGSKLLLGSSALLINTDGSGMTQIGTNVAGSAHLTAPQLPSPTMNGAGTEFLYTMIDLSDASQLAVARLNPVSLGGDPTVSNINISPNYIVITPGAASTVTTISGQVSASESGGLVTDALLYNGVSSNHLNIGGNEVDSFADNQLYDDGSHGDATAGDGTYTNNGIGTEGTVLGPRTVRVMAQVQDDNGLLHGTAVEVDGLTMVSHAPATPASSVKPLPRYTNSTAFTVSWSGNDGGGSGIASYDIYVSDNGGGFTPFLTGTTLTSATFNGQDGHTYGFYSVATDNDGNRQPTPSAAQASTLVDVTPPTSTVTALPAIVRTTSFLVSWSGGDGANGFGIASYNIYVSDNSAPFKLWQSVPATTTSATYAGLDGHAYSFYSLATDNAGNPQTIPGTTANTTAILPADHLVIHVPGQGIVGGTLAVTVDAANPDGVTDPLWEGSVALSLLAGPAGGRLSGTTVAAVHNGVATFTNLSLNVAGGGYELLAASTGILVAGVSATIAVAPTTHFSLTRLPVTLTAGGSFNVTVTALTAGNVADTSYLGTIHFTSSDPQAVLPPDFTFAASDHGKKSLTVTLKTAGSQTVSVADITRAAAAGKSAVVSVAAAAASGLQVTGYATPDAAGAAHSFSVTAVDPFGNPAPTYRGKVQFGTGDSAALLPPDYTFVAADHGRHSFNATYATAGTWSLTAADVAQPSINGSEANIAVLDFAAGVSGPTEGVCGQPLTFTLTAAETGNPSGTVFTYKIDWDGNGTVDQVVTGPTGTTVVHAFPTAGSDTVKVIAVDGTGNVTPLTATQTVAITATMLEADPSDGTKTALVIGGTSGNDIITISPADASGAIVTVTINGVVQRGGPFAPTGHLLVYGQGGNDTIQEVTKVFGTTTATVAVPAVLFAGTGNTTLSAAGSSANNVLVGGGGKDSLTGGRGRDILIGGAGASTLRAGGGGDILIAGRTAYDADLAALLAVLAEWGRPDRSYAARVSNLFNGGSDGLNGTARLAPPTVTVAAGVDQLFGGAGSDWFWIAARPSATDQVNNFGLGDIVTFE